MPKLCLLGQARITFFGRRYTLKKEYFSYSVSYTARQPYTVKRESGEKPGRYCRCMRPKLCISVGESRSLRNWEGRMRKRTIFIDRA